MPGKESRHHFLWHQQEEELAHLRDTFREDAWLSWGDQYPQSQKTTQDSPALRWRTAYHYCTQTLPAICPSLIKFRRHAGKLGFELYSSPEAPSERSWWHEDSHTSNEQERGCVSDSLIGLWFNLYWRDWQLTGKMDNGAHICSKEDWNGGACMGQRKKRVDWEGPKIIESTILPEQKGPRVETQIWTACGLVLNQTLLPHFKWILDVPLISFSHPSYQSFLLST